MRDHHESADFAEQKFMGGDARDVNLKNGLLFAFLGHRKRREERGNIEMPSTNIPGP